MKSIRCFALTALSLAAVTFGLPRAQAQTVAPIPSPTVITSAPYTINTPGYYVLGADLVYSQTSGTIITINASNVTLDFDGHYISGPSGASGCSVFGIGVTERGNLTIKNGTIAFCFEGIQLLGNTNSTLNINQTVDNMLITYCYSYGVYLRNASNSRVTNCRVSFTGGSTLPGNSVYAVAFDDGGSGNLVAENVITDTGSSSNTPVYGIYGTGNYDADHNRVTGVTSTSGGTATGITSPIFGTRNTVVSAKIGMTGGVLQGNLTKACSSAGLSGGYNDGGQNASF